MKDKPANLSFNFQLLRLILRAYEAKEKGFVVGMILGFCLITIVVGVSMMVVAQGNKLNTLSETKHEKSFEIAETGITRFKSLLTKSPALAGKADSEWSGGDPGGSATLSTQEQHLRDNIGEWISVDDSNTTLVEPGQFKILEYTPDLNLLEATLVVQGRTDLEDSLTQLQVILPLIPESFIAPGLWAKQDHYNPVGGSYPFYIQNPQIVSAQMRMSYSGTRPLIPPQSYKNPAYTSGYSIDWIDEQMPAVPPLPTTGTTGVYHLSKIDVSSGCYLRLPRKVGNNSNCTGGLGFAQFNNIATADQPGSDGKYHYIVDSTGSWSDPAITLSDAVLVIDPLPDTKVVLYVKGTIKLSGGTGNQVITTPVSDEPECPGSSIHIRSYINQGNPRHLEIYGAYPQNSTSWDVPFIEMSNATINGFILSPSGRVKESNSTINGKVWANTVDFSNNAGGFCEVAILEKDVGTDLVVFENSDFSTSDFFTIGPTKNWATLEANSN